MTEIDSWQILTEALPQLIWAAAPDGACTYFSTQWTEYTGVPESEMLGWGWMALLHPDDTEPTRQYWMDSVAGRIQYDVEYRVRRWDGEYGWFKTRGTPVRNGNGNIVRWFGTCTDITDQKRAEEALRFSEQELREARRDLEKKVASRTAERMRAEEALRIAQADLAHVTRVTTIGEMAASIAHEVNQPLTAVVTNGSACIRWLSANPPNLDEARRAVGRIINDGNRAGEVIRRIRALVKNTPPQYECLDINELIREVTAIAHSEARRSGASIQTHLCENVPSIVGDRIQLQQVILNLAMNGMEAMSEVMEEPKEILVSSSSSGPNAIVVEVRDGGIGLDPENLTNLFSAFYTTKPSGMGMGLAISRSIVEAHGGRLWAEPNKPRGAVFRFSLPTQDENTL